MGQSIEDPPNGLTGRPESECEQRFTRTAVIARMLHLLGLLQSGLTYTPDQLAFELQVNRRTVFRDLRRLEDAGVEIRFDPERSSYRLGPHFATPIPRLDDLEVFSLLLAAKVSPLTTNPVLGPPVRTALSRILAKSPEPTQQSAGRILSACIAEGTPPTINGDVLRTILTAIGQFRQVRITFRDAEATEPQQTKLSPFRIFVQGAQWYLYGRSTWHGRRAAFRLAEIQAAELTDDPFTMPTILRLETVRQAVLRLGSSPQTEPAAIEHAATEHAAPARAQGKR